MRLISRKYLLLGGSFNSFLRTDPQRIEIQCKPPGAVFLRGEEETKDPAVCKSFLQNAAPHLLIMSPGEPVRSDQTDSFVRSVHCAGRADRLRLLTGLFMCYNKKCRDQRALFQNACTIPRDARSYRRRVTDHSARES